ncbi:twin-arginine translocase subunit TatC [Elusimicrobiota bacterium]
MKKTMTTQKNNRSEDKTVIGHLDELRIRIFYFLAYFIVGMLAGLIFSKDIITFLKIPSIGIIKDFVFIKPTEIVTVYIKISLFAGLVFSLPALLFNLWKFFKPALDKTIKINFINWIVSAVLLFLGGTAFSFKIFLPLGLNFLMKISSEIAYPMITLNGYISFVLSLLLVGGIIFEIPVISAVLTKLGILTPQLMRKKRKEAVFTLTIFAAVITPTTDIFNLMLFVLPMVLLYEISILISAIMYRKSGKIIIDGVYENEN